MGRGGKVRGIRIKANCVLYRRERLDSVKVTGGTLKKLNTDNRKDKSQKRGPTIWSLTPLK